MATSKKPTVLLVDDDSMMRSVLKIILKSEGYREIDEASNGEEAIAQCLRLRPDLVLLDINMPKMTGLQALEGIRQASPTSRVLMVSAESTLDKVDEALKKGAAGFVVKPITAANVLAKIEGCLKRRANP